MANMGKNTFFYPVSSFFIITLYNPNQQDTSLKAFSLISRLANAPVAFVTYLEKTFWPNDLAVFYPFPYQIPAWQVLGATISDSRYQRCCYCSSKTFAVFVCWMDVVCNNYFACYRDTFRYR